MADYQDMYLTMVKQTEKAITLTEQALNILIAAQRDCEEMYINSPDPVIKLLVKDAGIEDEQEEEVSDKKYTDDEKPKIGVSDMDKNLGQSMDEEKLAFLSERQREAWLLSAQGLTRKEIAEKLGITYNAVTERIHHTERKFREYDRRCAAKKRNQE